MPLALDESVKEQVRKLWFSGETRKNIAAECQIGAGSVTNIMNEWMMGLGGSDYESMRELAVQLRKEGLTPPGLASIYRRHKYIKKLGASEEQIESLIVNLLDCVKSTPAEKIAEMTDQIFEIAKTESISPAEVPAYVKQKIEEKHRFEEEIKQADATLQNKNVDIQTIEEFKKLEAELEKYGLSMDAPRTLVSILQTINQMGYDPRKILTELARIKSLRETERRLKRECKMLESQSVQYKEILPTCQHIARLGIGFPELMMFQTAITKRADMENLPPGRAAYRVMQDIEDYNKLSDMKTQLYNVVMQINMMKNISARQNDAMTALMKLQCYGITDDQILRMCRIIEVNGHHNINGIVPTRIT
jgi:DNA repair exonuclease SbcCD ATPase subunit